MYPLKEFEFKYCVFVLKDHYVAIQSWSWPVHLHTSAAPLRAITCVPSSITSALPLSMRAQPSSPLSCPSLDVFPFNGIFPRDCASQSLTGSIRKVENCNDCPMYLLTLSLHLIRCLRDCVGQALAGSIWKAENCNAVIYLTYMSE